VPVGPALLALQGVIRHYAWGSPTAIPELLGIEPTGEPAAELWLGAHPDAPAEVPAVGATLDKLIVDDPLGMLGPAVVERFGPRLPFLVKVIAPAHVLSLQVHPTLAQARVGFAAEEARGLPRDSAPRSYRDANHKPELLCALTDFDALCGFRPMDETRQLIDILDVPALVPYRDRLSQSDGLRSVFTALLELDDAGRVALVPDVLDACRRVARTTGDWSREAEFVLRAADDYPADIGPVLCLLLNAVPLRSGEAIFLAAGNVHAYLRGVGVEIMATSDNTLRCGMTPKHVDVPEVLRITDFTPLPEPRWPAQPDRSGEHVFQPPIPDFALSMVALDGSVELTTDGPQILLCTDGSADISSAGADVSLGRGQAVFVAAGRACGVAGKGTVFRGTTGTLSHR
jgi:mannose-6-phosphate isomerase